MENSPEKVVRVAIVGPECTGKSTLSMQLAEHYKTTYVPEYAREYIESLKRPYTIDDIVTISKGQMQKEDELAALANRVLICDTNLIVTKIWAEFKYNICPTWIKENIIKRKYAIHLLTATDIPWEKDPQREHPDKRKELFELYEQELVVLNLNYTIIKGTPAQRLKTAITAINELL
jgi:NadR type nicotinamide-nucleotide adenylyltransferase